MQDDDNYSSDFLNSFWPSKDGQAEIDFKMQLASKIYHAMKAKGWNVIEFAAQMNTQVSVVSLWLSGTHDFDSDTLFKIENKLGICQQESTHSV